MPPGQPPPGADLDRPADDGWLASSRRIAGGLTLRAGGEIVAKIASTAFFVAAARQLGRDSFGAFTFALSLTSLLLLASGFGTEELMAREVARDRRSVHTYLPNVVAVKVLASIGLLLVAVAVVNLGDFTDEAKMATYIIGVGIAAENLGRTWNAVFSAYERFGMTAISLMLQRILTAAIGVTILLTGGGLVAASLVYTCGAIVGLLTANWILQRCIVRVRWAVDRTRWLPLLRAGLPIGMVSLLFMLLLRVDTILLGVFSGENSGEVGTYGAAFRLVETTFFISWAFSASALPWIARRQEAEGVARAYELGTKAITSILTPVALVLVLAAPELVDLLYGEAYEGAVLPLRLLGAVTVLYGVNSLGGTVLISQDRPKDQTVILAAVSAINVIINLALIPRYGADATAFTAAVSALLLAVLGFVVVRHRFGAVSPVKAFAGPTVGGGAMAAVVLWTGLPLLPALLLGLVSYAASVLTFERLWYPDDFTRLRAILAFRAPDPASMTSIEGTMDAPTAPGRHLG